MYVKIEPSGCCVRRGMVQIRFCMYLDKDDYGYKKHHVKVDGKWQVNPFHNHFVLVEPITTDEEIMDIAEAFLHEAGVKWSIDGNLDLVNDALPFNKLPVIDDARIVDCEARLQSVRTLTVEVRV